jgi:hypothetical protein
LPSQLPSLPQPAAPASLHWLEGIGSWPAGMFVQVPPLPESAHDLQVPVQAVAQHFPWAQNVELHSSSPPQVAPIGFLPQLPPTQVLGATQSASLAQSVRQAPFDPHRNGAQLDEEPAWQVPAPSQVPADVSVEPVQPAKEHCVPAMNCRQWPAPSQVPSFPQVVASAAWHCDAELGAAPAGIGVQVPGVPWRLHATHVPAHPVLQQVPCSQ